MTTIVEIPLIAAQQTLNINLDGVQYQLRVTWNAPSSCWLLDVSDSDGVAIAQGIALTSGADLLEQLEYLGIGGALVAQTDGDENAQPTFANLGENGHLYFITP